jgi:hypothetical protein
VPSFSYFAFFVEAELSFLISENRKTRLKDSETGDFFKLFLHIRHEPVKLNANTAPALHELAKLCIMGLENIRRF